MFIPRMFLEYMHRTWNVFQSWQGYAMKGQWLLILSCTSEFTRRWLQATNRTTAEISRGQGQWCVHIPCLLMIYARIPQKWWRILMSCICYLRYISQLIKKKLVSSDTAGLNSKTHYRQIRENSETSDSVLNYQMSNFRAIWFVLGNCIVYMNFPNLSTKTP